MTKLSPEKAIKMIDAGNVSGSEIYAMTHQCDDAGKNYYKLYKAYRYGDLKSLPEIFDRVVKEKLWENWRWLGKNFSASSIVEYIESEPPNGLGASVEIFIKLLPTVDQGKFRKASTAELGTNQHADNISTLKPKHGTSLAYTLDRLERENPKLFAKVVAGEMSANAAAIKAGFRKKPLKRCPECGHEWR